jgi:aminoglycoside 2'-N-acetyltransferase I
VSTIDLRVAHTGDLEAAELGAARALLYEVFDDMTEEDWEHALGGIHAIARQDGQVVGHASLVMRRLLHRGRAWRTGYVEGVAVRQDQRRQGLGRALMAPLERLIRGSYDVGALGASDEAASFYAQLGWRLWQGTTFALTPAGVVRTPDDDDCIFLMPVTEGLDFQGDLMCDFRDGAAW